MTDLGDFVLHAPDLFDDGVPYGYGPRRAVLDKILLDAASAAGVEVRDEFAVDDVVSDGGRVSGIRGRSARGSSPTTIRARLTIGADGRHSGIARGGERAMYEHVPTLACWYFTYFSDVPAYGLEIYRKQRRAIFVHPTNDDLTAVFVGSPIEEFPTIRSDPERSFMDTLALAPELFERVDRWPARRALLWRRRRPRTSCASRTAPAGRSWATPVPQGPAAGAGLLRRAA